MSVKIQIDESRVAMKVENAFHTALGKLSSQILNDCNQYCKEDTGTLIASSYIHSRLEEGRLIWQTPYARRQYWEIPTASTDKNPHAQWKWCEAAKAEHKDKWNQQAQRLMEGAL